MLQNVQITNMNFEKLLEHKMFFLSMASFVSAVLFIPSFNVLSCYFYDSLNLVAVPTAWILINKKYFVTQLLNFLYVCHKHYSTAQLFGGF